MNEIVVDTNVWASAGKPISEAVSIIEIDCIESCADWINEFLDSDLKILVDSHGLVIDEYQTFVIPGRYPESALNRLYTELWGRLEFKAIEFDAFGHALLPEGIDFHDLADRKFIALAITCNPYAPIYNSVDTDWAKEEAQLSDYGLVIRELCPNYIRARIHNT